MRNFVPAHEMIERGDWQVSDIARHAFDLEGKVVGTIGAGRIGYRVLQRLVPYVFTSALSSFSHTSYKALIANLFSIMIMRPFPQVCSH